MAFVFNEEENSVELWGVEIKSRQTNDTINKEREFNKKKRRKKHMRIGWREATHYLLKPDERYQLLHHAYVYGLERVALVVGTKSGKVVSGTVINFSFDLHESYEKVIDTLKNKALLWAYQPVTTIPNDVIQAAQNVPMINGTEALYGALKLWQTMFPQDDLSHLPRPALQRILPSTHAQWNATKGGSDTVTKIVDDCFLNPPR